MFSKVFACVVLTFHIACSRDSNRGILQGAPAKLRQFPYVVFVDNTPLVPTALKGWVCSGAIITELWVITAAHCYTGYAAHNVSITDVHTHVRAGTIDRDFKTSTTQDRVANHHILMEPNNTKKNLSRLYNNDVAILKVSQPFVFNAHVGSITIAKRPLPEGDRLPCILVGFGDTERGDANQNTKLHYTNGRLDGDKYSCRKRAESVWRADAEDWGEEHLCVDPVNYLSSPCSGDSGGPIVCNGVDAGTSVGRINMLGVGPSCGAKGNYHVYMFLGYYEAWLREHIPELPPSRRVNDGPLRPPDIVRDKKGATSGGAVADIGLVVFTLGSRLV